VGENEVILHFDNRATITVESSWTITRGDHGRTYERAPESASAISRLLGETVRAVERLDSQTLRLAFEEGTTLDLHDSNAPQYESFQITFGDRTIVV
jgi:hypothetical protein